MKTTIHFTNCPGADDYNRYLSGQGPEEFKHAFEEHLTQCPLCSESIEGYRLCHTSPSKTMVQKPLKKLASKKVTRKHIVTWGSIAALIAIAVGIFGLVWKPYQPAIIYSLNNGAEPVLGLDYKVTSSTNGKLTNQLSEDYWYVCNQDIFINDQEINPVNIDNIIENLDPSKPLIIEVGCACDEQLDQLIEKIKNTKKINVYTYSKEARVRPNQS